VKRRAKERSGLNNQGSIKKRAQEYETKPLRIKGTFAYKERPLKKGALK